jgi:pimeloyl-ACP methyl ester carboxylesterase
LDYRGYGKSEGTISSENQFYGDVQAAYNVLKKRYAQDKIIILGYSLGTGAATILASNNKPKHLILQAPYYSLTDMMKQHYPFAPTFLLKYRVDVRLFLPKVKAPVTVFHGNNDAIIYYGSSLKLKEHFKASDQLITLEGGRHNGMSSNPDYLIELDKLLAH